jgi:uncharacterized protein with FMN-binding domain
MKKYILSTLVISTFAVYALLQRMTGVVIDPNQIAASNSQPSTTNNVAPVKAVATVPKPKINVSIGTVKAPSPAPTPVLVAKTPVLTPAPVIPTPPANVGQYKNGQYTGDAVDAYYGTIQVQAIITGGRLTDVKFLDYPQDRNTSIRVNTYAMPILTQEAVAAQSANVNAVSGATDSSGAFVQSLSSALAQAQNA